MKNRTKTISLLLAVCMMITLLPAVALAVDYDLWVGGVQVTSENANSITGPGITGTVSYDDENKKLTLKGATITGYNTGSDGDVYGICSWLYEELTIVLEDNNSIVGQQGTTSSGGGLGSSYGMFSNAPLRFTGSGSLTVSSANATRDKSLSVAIYAYGDITVENGCTITASCGTAIETAAPIYPANSGKLMLSGSNCTARNSAAGSARVPYNEDNLTSYDYLWIEPGTSGGGGTGTGGNNSNTGTGGSTTHTHCVCGATHSNVGDHISPENEDWEPWTNIDWGNKGVDSTVYTPLFLLSDVTLDHSISLGGGLCLNGHVLTLTNGATINLTGSSVITDCQTTEHKFTVGSDGVWVLEETNGTKSVYGGVITGGNQTGDSTAAPGAVVAKGMPSMFGGNIVGNKISHSSGSSGGGILVKGIMSMYGGSIQGNRASWGGGVCVHGTFNMYGGEIKNNNAKSGGGIFAAGDAANSVVCIYSGSITGNTAVDVGGGVYYEYGSTMEISGNVNISGNKKDINENNVHLNGNYFKVGTMTGGTIGVTKTNGGRFSTGGADYKGNFSSDDPAYDVAVTSDGGNLELVANGTGNTNPGGSTPTPTPTPSTSPDTTDPGNTNPTPTPTPTPGSAPGTVDPGTSSGISLWYNGGNSFGSSNSAVPTSVEIDGVPVSFNGNGREFTVGCISPNAKWVTVNWNSTSVTTNFTPDANATCAEIILPKTGDVSVMAFALMAVVAAAGAMGKK